MNNEYITTDPADYFQRMIDDINHASDTIEFESYIFEDDKIGRRVINALGLASQRGVKVRLMVDGFGSPPWIQRILNQLKQQGGEVRIYHPMPWHFWHWGMAINREDFFNKLLYLFKFINRRNHRKTCVIDKRIYWIGSFNIAIAHLPQEQGGENWRDTAIRIETVCPEFQIAFEQVWQHRFIHRPAYINDLSSGFRLNNSRRKRRRLYRDLLSRISLSSDRIWITTPYFIPEPRLLKRLRKAAERGVDVCLLLPAVSDVFFMPWASAWFYPELMKSGAKIFEYHGGVLHAKTVMIDDWATIGSSNINSRSIRHDLEIDYAVQQSDSLCQLQQHFENDMQQSRQIFEADIQKRNPIIKLLGRIALYLRYWL